MKVLLALLCTVALAASGCTQTGQAVEKGVAPLAIEEPEPPDVSDNQTEAVLNPEPMAAEGGTPPQPESPGKETPATPPTPEAAPQPPDPCEGVACPPSRATCPDGVHVSCPTTCAGGTCSSCVPDCSGHPCIEQWACGAWSPCTASQQTRTCTDAAACPSPAGKPPETQPCAVAHVLITEVAYDTNDTREEWIELHNPTSADVRLAGWSLADNSGSWTLPDATVPAGASLVVARNATAFSAVHGCAPAVEGFSRGLNNGGDQLALADAAGAAIDFVAWEGGDKAAYPAWTIEAGRGLSLRRNGTADTDAPEDWLSDQQPDPAC